MTPRSQNALEQFELRPQCHCLPPPATSGVANTAGPTTDCPEKQFPSCKAQKANRHRNPAPTPFSWLPCYHGPRNSNPNKGACADGLITNDLKTLSPYKAVTLSLLNYPSKHHRFLMTGATQSLPQLKKPPRTTDPNLFRPTSLTYGVFKMFESILNEKVVANLSRHSTLTNRLVTEELMAKCLDEGSAVDQTYLKFS